MNAATQALVVSKIKELKKQYVTMQDQANLRELAGCAYFISIDRVMRTYATRLVLTA